MQYARYKQCNVQCAQYIIIVLIVLHVLDVCIYLSVGGTGQGPLAKLLDPGQINLVVGRPLLYKVSQYNPSTTDLMNTKRCTVENNVVFVLKFDWKDHNEDFICICYCLISSKCPEYIVRGVECFSLHKGKNEEQLFRCLMLSTV